MQTGEWMESKYDLYFLDVHGKPGYMGENYYILVYAESLYHAEEKLERRYPGRVYTGGDSEIRDDGIVVFDSDGFSQVLVNQW